MNKRQRKKFKKKLYHHKWDHANKALILAKAMEEMARVMGSKQYFVKKEEYAEVYIANLNRYLENTPYMIQEDTIHVDDRGILRFKLARRPIHVIDIYVGDSTSNDIDKEVGNDEQTSEEEIRKEE